MQLVRRSTDIAVIDYFVHGRRELIKRRDKCGSKRNHTADNNRKGRPCNLTVREQALRRMRAEGAGAQRSMSGAEIFAVSGNK